MNDDEPSIHRLRSLHLRALDIPFAGVLDYVAFLVDGCGVFAPMSANDDPYDYPPDWA
jgi:hypothetical protein